MSTAAPALAARVDAEHAVAVFRRRYGGEPAVIARAPGRVDLMGSHTDYNEGRVLTLAVSRETWIAARPARGGRARMYSEILDEEARFAADEPSPIPARDWSDYPRGVLRALAREGIAIGGMDAAVCSSVPMGGGLSSSAALEMAMAIAVTTMAGVAMPPKRMALLCQRAENEFVGVNCGVLDQISSAMGGALLLDCRNLATKDVRITNEIAVVVAHTLAPRMLARSEYGDRRRQCEACARTAAAAFPGVRTLRDVTRGQLLELKPNLDPLVHRRGLFIIEEDARVPEFAEALAGGDLARLGALTGESFEGARGLFEITVPAMVELRDAMLRAPGAIGARQAGAGFGGCMVALVESNRSADFVAALARSYYAPRGKDPVVHVVTAAPGAGIVPVPSSRP